MKKEKINKISKKDIEKFKKQLIIAIDNGLENTSIAKQLKKTETIQLFKEKLIEKFTTTEMIESCRNNFDFLLVSKIILEVIVECIEYEKKSLKNEK